MIEVFHQPRAFRQALRLKARYGVEASAVVGGTDLLVKLRAGRVAPKAVIDLSQAGVGYIRRGADYVRIGAAATAGDFLRVPWARAQAPALWDACLQLGGPQIQNGATFAGNLANASPAADTPPVLLVLDAQVIIQSLARGERIVPVADFLLGPGKTALQTDELIREVRFPRASLIQNGRGRAAKSGPVIKSSFLKVGPRRAQVISVCCIAGWAEIDPAATDPRALLKTLRLAAGGVAPKTTRLHAAESHLVQHGLTRDTVAQAADLVAHDIAPISDVRGSARYKALLARNLTLTFIESLLPVAAQEAAS